MSGCETSLMKRNQIKNFMDKLYNAGYRICSKTLSWQIENELQKGIESAVAKGLADVDVLLYHEINEGDYET